MWPVVKKNVTMKPARRRWFTILGKYVKYPTYIGPVLRTMVLSPWTSDRRSGNLFEACFESKRQGRFPVRERGHGLRRARCLQRSRRAAVLIRGGTNCETQKFSLDRLRLAPVISDINCPLRHLPDSTSPLRRCDFMTVFI